MLTNFGPTSTSIILPNKEKTPAYATAHLPIKNFSKNATKTYLLKDLKNTNLISLGQLCDDGCYVLLTKKKLYICKDKNILLQGYRNQSDGLWDITLPQKMPTKINTTTNMPIKCNALLFKKDHFQNDATNYPILLKKPVKSVVNKIN